MNYIGIPTVNNIKYLKGTIDSLHTSYDYRLLVVDNASDDGVTREWIQAQEFESILNDSNVGVSVSWNQIINWAISNDDCQTIFILNNDIVLAKKTLGLLIEDLVEAKKDCVSGVNVGNNPLMLEHLTRGKNRWSPAVNFSCFGLTPRVIKRVGFFDEGFKRAYFEDNDYHKRMEIEGVESACDLWAPFIHYGSRSIKEGGVKHEPYFSQNREYFRKKWGYSPDGK